MSELFVPSIGDRVRVVAVGPGDGFADDSNVIGLEGTVENAEPSFQDQSWLWLELNTVGRLRSWSFLECRVELVIGTGGAS